MAISSIQDESIIVVNNLNDYPSLLRNQAPPTNAWLLVKLIGAKTNRAAIGSRVVRRRERPAAGAGGSKRRQFLFPERSAPPFRSWGQRKTRGYKSAGWAGRKKPLSTYPPIGWWSSRKAKGSFHRKRFDLVLSVIGRAWPSPRLLPLRSSSCFSRRRCSSSPRASSVQSEALKQRMLKQPTHQAIGLLREWQACGRSGIDRYLPLPAGAQDPSLYNLKGLAASELGRDQEAEESFRTVIHLSPKAPMGYNNLGVLLSKLGRYRKQQPHFHEAHVREPEYFTALLGLGSSFATLSKYDEAVNYLQKAWTSSPRRLSDGIRMGTRAA